MPSFACKDIGMDCKFQTTAPTEAELMKKIAEHAKSAHKIDPVPPILWQRSKKQLKSNPFLSFQKRLFRPYAPKIGTQMKRRITRAEITIQVFIPLPTSLTGQNLANASFAKSDVQWHACNALR